MKLSKIALLLAAFGIFVVACSKSSSGGTTPAASIQGNWNFQSGEIKGYLGSILGLDSTIKPSAGDYFDFNTSGTLYSQVAGTKDTSTYALIGSSKISFNYEGTLDTFSIVTLTQSACTLSYTSPSVDTTIGGIATTVHGVLNFNLSR